MDSRAILANENLFRSIFHAHRMNIQTISSALYIIHLLDERNIYDRSLDPKFPIDTFSQMKAKSRCQHYLFVHA